MRWVRGDRPQPPDRQQRKGTNAAELNGEPPDPMGRDERPRRAGGDSGHTASGSPAASERSNTRRRLGSESVARALHDLAAADTRDPRHRRCIGHVLIMLRCHEHRAPCRPLELPHK